MLLYQLKENMPGKKNISVTAARPLSGRGCGAIWVSAVPALSGKRAEGTQEGWIQACLGGEMAAVGLVLAGAQEVRAEHQLSQSAAASCGRDRRGSAELLWLNWSQT